MRGAAAMRAAAPDRRRAARRARRGAPRRRRRPVRLLEGVVSAADRVEPASGAAHLDRQVTNTNAIRLPGRGLLGARGRHRTIALSGPGRSPARRASSRSAPPTAASATSLSVAERALGLDQGSMAACGASRSRCAVAVVHVGGGRGAQRGPRRRRARRAAAFRRARLVRRAHRAAAARSDSRRCRPARRPRAGPTPGQVGGPSSALCGSGASGSGRAAASRAPPPTCRRPSRGGPSSRARRVPSSSRGATWIPHSGRRGPAAPRGRRRPARRSARARSTSPSRPARRRAGDVEALSVHPHGLREAPGREREPLTEARRVPPRRDRPAPRTRRADPRRAGRRSAPSTPRACARWRSRCAGRRRRGR